MNDDTISRQAVISELNKYVDYSDDGEQEINSDIVFITLKEFPSAVRRGRWIRTGEDGYCSVCKCDMPMFRNDWEWEYTETPFCPNCGARMEEEA